MASADRDRWEPLRQLRQVDQATSADLLTAALARSAEHERALEAARGAVDEARARVECAEVGVLELAARGTTAAVLALAGCHLARCRRRLVDDELALQRAEAAHGAGELELAYARDRLAKARAHRQLVERRQERERRAQVRLLDRRAE